MIYLLLDNRQQKAQVLADYFNVSTKTIYRDVETLSKAGIPITMQQGVSGGIILDERYMTNQKKLSEREEKGLTAAIDNIRKLPNAQLEYALKMLKQYFNEAGTLWINTNDASMLSQEKFHTLKIATIERYVIEFDYFMSGHFLHFKVEPYELRIAEGIWSLIVRQECDGSFLEMKISRMKNINLLSTRFDRKKLPDEFTKKNTGALKNIDFEVNQVTDEVLDKFPIECINFNTNPVTLKISVPIDVDSDIFIKRYPNLKLMK